MIVPDVNLPIDARDSSIREVPIVAVLIALPMFLRRPAPVR